MIDNNIREINRCNQRGGRMLSIVDLLDKNTINIEQASYLFSIISKGGSFIVGAEPSGVGKTTLMCAFLSFLPSNKKIFAVDSFPIDSTDDKNIVYVAHEISSGPYFSYLWGEESVKFFELDSQKATNLHANDIEQAREVIVDGCGVSEKTFQEIELKIFLSSKKQISKIYEKTELTYSGFEKVGEPKIGKSDPGLAELLKKMQKSNQKTSKEVRDEILSFLQN